MEFFPNKPVTETETGIVQVTFGEAGPLAPGFHTFQLVVVDDLGVSSDPVTARVFVKGKPVAVLTAPERVPLGDSFQLDGSRSDPQDGKITQWIFTLLPGEER